MTFLAIGSFVIALVAAFVGFSDVATGAASIAKICFVIAVAATVAAVAVRRPRG
jgi:uncharacterized membrane protein YtjA (UPF0391 family)